jgi:hypothetical protein
MMFMEIESICRQRQAHSWFFRVSRKHSDNFRFKFIKKPLPICDLDRIIEWKSNSELKWKIKFTIHIFLMGGINWTSWIVQNSPQAMMMKKEWKERRKTPTHKTMKVICFMLAHFESFSTWKLFSVVWLIFCSLSRLFHHVPSQIIVVRWTRGQIWNFKLSLHLSN